MDKAHLAILSAEWIKLKNALIAGETKDLSIEEILRIYNFPNNLAQIIQGTGKLFELESFSIGQIYKARGTKVDLDKPYIMITTPEYAKSQNRMNPPGRAFNYCGVLPINKGVRDDIAKAFILNTLKAEVRADPGSEITICKLKTTRNLKIFNMYLHEQVPINFEDFWNLFNSNVDSFKGTYDVRMKKIKIYAAEMFAKYFFNLFNSENIFKPVHSNIEEERANEYAPFQFIASYIESLGYDGIKFKSTVEPNGANLVIFECENLQVLPETMEHIIVS